MARSPLVAALCALLAATSAQAQAPSINDEARRHFRAGVNFLEDPDGARYEEAYSAFKAAYAASSSPKILGNIGLCAMKLERDSEAIEAYARYLREVKDIDPEERAQIERDLSALKSNVAMVALGVAPAQLTITDRRLANSRSAVVNVYKVQDGQVAIGLRPGRHELRLEAPGYQEMVWEMDLPAGARVSRSLRLTPAAPPAPPPAPKPPPQPSLAGPVITTSLGGSLLIAGAVTGIVALNKTRSIERHCPGTLCPAGYDLDSARSDARSYVRVTDGLLLGGALVTAVGVTWLTVNLTEPPPTAGRASPPKSRWTAGGMCTSTGCAGSLRVPF